MDDRNLVAVAEQAAATSLVKRSPLAGCTVLADGGRHFRGCRLEFDDPSADLCAVANAVAASRVDGARRIKRAGYYTPSSGELPVFSAATLHLLQQVATEDFRIIISTGSGTYIERSLRELQQEAGVA
jgi:cytidine deaminase